MQVIFPLLLSVLAAFFNMTIANAMRVMNCAPDILLGVILAASIHYGPLTGAFSGLLGGLIIDSFFGPYLGMSAILYMFCGFFMGWIHQPNRNFFEKLLSSTIWAAGTYILQQLIGLLAVYFNGGLMSISLVFLTGILPGTLYNTLFAVAVSLLLGLLFSRPFLQPRWRKDIFRQSLM